MDERTLLGGPAGDLARGKRSKDMSDKIKVGILGANGPVGQRFAVLLERHPWFEVTALCASERSRGRTYAEACNWILSEPMPRALRNRVLMRAEPGPDCEIVFSGLPTAPAREVERNFARAGYGVYSNASAFRYAADVPLMIPEVNPEHLGLIEVQQRQRQWSGYIVTNANCTTTHLICALHPLHQAFRLNRLFVCTMQAVSGAGYPGVSSLDILDNVIPHIRGEEEKVEEREPHKLLGHFDGQGIVPPDFRISAHCNRVPTYDGHLEAISLEFKDTARREDILHAWETYDPLPQRLGLPSAPRPPIVYMAAADRPQPRLDRLAGSVPGMATVVGRLRPDPLLDFKFLVLGHNTIRGAAGGSLLNAELYYALRGPAANGRLSTQTQEALAAL